MVCERFKQTNVGREVPIWYKFSFLSELLEASMVRPSPSSSLVFIRD